MTRLFELTRGDGALDTAVRRITLGILLLFCVALVSTTLLLRNQNRHGDAALPESIASIQGAHLEP